MDEQPGLSDRYRLASPWPVFVAVGLALSEVGVIMGFFPVAVGGLLLLVGSVSGILREAGYVDRPWGMLVGLGAALVAFGLVVVWTQADPGADSVAAVLASTDGAVVRGEAIAVAGFLSLLAGAVGWVLEETRV